MIIAIDFDGTIVEHRYPEIGPLKSGSADTIRWLKSRDHAIVIWTCRCNLNPGRDDLDKMAAFLRENGIPFDSINENADGVWGCYPKIYADLYIDDRSIFFSDDWDKIREELERSGA